MLIILFRFHLQVMDNVYTHCRSRGADGFAFVIQNEGLNELGQSGMGMGYHDINNSLAVEFDTWHNPEMLDDYENHISVQTRGWRHRNRYVHLPTGSIIIFLQFASLTYRSRMKMRVYPCALLSAGTIPFPSGLPRDPAI